MDPRLPRIIIREYPTFKEPSTLLTTRVHRHLWCSRGRILTLMAFTTVLKAFSDRFYGVSLGVRLHRQLYACLSDAFFLSEPLQGPISVNTVGSALTDDRSSRLYLPRLRQIAESVADICGVGKARASVSPVPVPNNAATSARVARRNAL